MQNPESLTDRELLYDPLFETPPDTEIRDIPGRGFWGKAAVRKTVFVLFLCLFVGASIALSFSSLSKPRFRYGEADGGRELSEFTPGKTDAVLEIGPVFDADGAPVPDETVVSVRTFAVCCNEVTSVALIGPTVREIPNTAFFSCSGLIAALVDPANPYFRSVGGCLYRQQDGRLTELMLCPAKSYLYRALLSLGETPPDTAESAEAFAARAAALEEKSADWLKEQKKDEPDGGLHGLTAAEAKALQRGLTLQIEPGVTRIGELAAAECEALFELGLPEGVTEIASMAFYKCAGLRLLTLPDSLESLGSDAFSYCERLSSVFIPAGVKRIGHHAFFGCSGVDEVCLAAAESEAPETGQDWLPKKRKLFERDVPVVYGVER